MGSPAPGTAEMPADGIVVVSTSTADGKIGAIIGDRVALAVDAGISASEGESLAAAIAQLDRGTDHLAYTHGHTDHVLGSGAWRGGEVYAHHEAAAHIDRQLGTWAERYGGTEQQVAASIARPTARFDGELSLDLGGREARIIPTPGHAPGASCILVPELGVLFGGDTVVTAIPPSFKDGHHADFEATLRTLATLDVEILVPGHGRIVRGQTEVRSAMLWSADYLARCRDHVAARRPSQTIDEIVAAARYEDFIGDWLPAEEHRMPWRHEQTLLSIAAQLEGGTGAT